MKAINMAFKIFEFLASILLMLLSYLVPKNDKLAVYGEWFGQRFANESLQEFLKAGHERRVVIVKNREEFRKLKNSFDVRMAYGLRGLCAQLRANHAYVNVSSRDLALGAIAGAKNFVQLGHGVPIKTFLLSEKDRGRAYQWRLRAKLRIFDRYTRVYCPFDYLADLYAASYAVPVENVETRAPVFRRFEGVVRKNLVSYMPTHRDEGRSFDDRGFRQLFEEIAVGALKPGKNLVIRLHPYEHKYTEQLQDLISAYKLSGRVSINNAHEGLDELVISDYSGVIFPFHYSGVPIVLFQWDRHSFSREFIEPKALDNILITDNVKVVLERINEI